MRPIEMAVVNKELTTTIYNMADEISSLKSQVQTLWRSVEALRQAVTLMGGPNAESILAQLRDLEMGGEGAALPGESAPAGEVEGETGEAGLCERLPQAPLDSAPPPEAMDISMGEVGTTLDSHGGGDVPADVDDAMQGGSPPTGGEGDGLAERPHTEVTERPCDSGTAPEPSMSTEPDPQSISEYIVYDSQWMSTN